MIKLGNNNIGDIYLGVTSIGKAYLGNNLVYQKGEGGVGPIFYTYLVFDGDSGIETNVAIPLNGSVCVNLGDETQTVTQGVFSTGTTSEGAIRHFLGGGTTATTRNMVAFYDSTSYVNYQDLSFTSPRYYLYMTPTGWGWGNAHYSYTKGSTHPTGGITFGSSSNGTRYTGSMQTFWIYGPEAQNAQSASEVRTYTPVATLRPCTYNGEAGLWHVEEGTFYGKTLGSGTLVATN